MDARNAVIRILPELQELEEVDFSKYSSQYLPLIRAFSETGRTGLNEFETFVRENGLEPSTVGNFLISLFQYLLIRYRRYGEYPVVKPAIKVFITLKGWLNENGFEKEWKLLLHNFAGYIVDMAEKTVEREDCEEALAYLTFAYRIAEEAAENFREEYFGELRAKVEEMLKSFYERCGIEGEPPKKREKVC
jgi:DNA-binding transcriptional ArsR family regulator